MAAPVTADRVAGRSNRALLVRGIGVSGLNPKGLLVLLALLPQFANPRGSWPLSAQLGLLGLVFTTRDRPVRSARGWSAAPVRHGVSAVRSGRRCTLGLVMHDAA